MDRRDFITSAPLIPMATISQTQHADDLATVLDVLADTVEVLIQSATPMPGACDRYVIVSRDKLTAALQALDDLVLTGTVDQLPASLRVQ